MAKVVDFNPFTDDPVDVAIKREGISDPTQQAYIKSLYHQESSSGKNTTTSNQGAHGPMQVTKGAFTDSGVKGDINDTMDSTHAGVRYAMQRLKASNGDVRLAAAGYYGGPGGQAQAAKGIPVYDPKNPKAPSTLQYADQVASRVKPNGATAMKGKVVDFDPFAEDTPAPAAVAAPEPTVQAGASEIPGQNLPPPMEPMAPKPPSILQRAKAAAGRLVDQAQTKEGWKAAGNAAINSALDLPNSFVTGAGNFVAPLVGAAQDTIKGDKLGTGNAAIRQGIESFAQDTARDPNSIGYRAQQAVPEMIATAAPQNAAVNALTGPAGSVLKRAAADVGVNAAYSGGRAAAEGKGITDVMHEAKNAAIGSSIAHGITGIVGGARAALPEAKRLFVERGGRPSAGQIIGGPVEQIERGLGNIPVVGEGMKISGPHGAIADSVDSFSTADVNRALEPIKHKVATSGETAVAEAVKHTEGNYEKLIPQTRMGPRAAAQAVQQGLNDTLGRMTPTSQRRWMDAYNQINDETHVLTANMRYSDGRIAKDVDSNLNRMIEDNREINPELARVARAVKSRLREALTPIPGAANSVTTELQNTNKARAQLFALEDAARMSGARTGHFTPAESFEARAATGKAPVDDIMNRMGRETQLANRPNSSYGTATGAGLGTLSASLGYKHGPAMFNGLSSGDPMAVLAATGIAGGVSGVRLANTKAGRKFLLEGLAGGLPKGGIRDIIQSQQAAQLAAQVGRNVATD
jgi:hypothetical protein